MVRITDKSMEYWGDFPLLKVCKMEWAQMFMKGKIHGGGTLEEDDFSGGGEHPKKFWVQVK